MTWQPKEHVAKIQAFKARLAAFNKKCQEKIKKEVALKTLGDKLAVFKLEQSVDQEVNKVDCLEEEVPTKDMDDEVMKINKSGNAQAQDPLVKVNIGDVGRRCEV